MLLGATKSLMDMKAGAELSEEQGGESPPVTCLDFPSSEICQEPSDLSPALFAALIMAILFSLRWTRRGLSLGGYY